jgi:hypothetical protein
LVDLEHAFDGALLLARRFAQKRTSPANKPDRLRRDEKSREAASMLLASFL